MEPAIAGEHEIETSRRTVTPVRCSRSRARPASAAKSVASKSRSHSQVGGPPSPREAEDFARIALELAIGGATRQVQISQ